MRLTFEHVLYVLVCYIRALVDCHRNMSLVYIDISDSKVSPNSLFGSNICLLSLTVSKTVGSNNLLF